MVSDWILSFCAKEEKSKSTQCRDFSSEMLDSNLGEIDLLAGEHPITRRLHAPGLRLKTNRKQVSAGRFIYATSGGIMMLRSSCHYQLNQQLHNVLIDEVLGVIQKNLTIIGRQRQTVYTGEKQCKDKKKGFKSTRMFQFTFICRNTSRIPGSFLSFGFRRAPPPFPVQPGPPSHQLTSVWKYVQLISVALLSDTWRIFCY